MCALADPMRFVAVAPPPLFHLEKGMGHDTISAVNRRKVPGPFPLLSGPGKVHVPSLALSAASVSATLSLQHWHAIVEMGVFDGGCRAS